jgi:UDP-N-acetylmuramoyl-tripeptide--D-alanyl-D-alanine ligase
MMLRMDLGELARAAEARVIGGELPIDVTAVSTDSRTLPSSALFVALRGENFDGHDFLQKALAHGACALVVEQECDVDPAVPQLVVENALSSLGEMAAHVRSHIQGPVVAVTGSNGKTTTKEMIAEVLSTQFDVLRTSGNYNNLIGLPLTLFELEAHHNAAVLEMGMNVPGEIGRLTQIAEPTIALITNVAAVHLAGLGSIEGVAKAKGELFKQLNTGAIAIINREDPLIESICVSYLHGQQQINFGFGNTCDVQISDVRMTQNTTYARLRIESASFDLRLPLVGYHHALNAASAAAVGLAAGVPGERMVDALGRVEVPGGRFKIREIEEKGLVVVDDTYNANPASMQAAFMTLAQLPANRRVAVLGDMYELGEKSNAEHVEVGRTLAQHGFDALVAVGGFSEHLAAGASAAGVDAHAFETVEDAISFLETFLEQGDWVLVKGSRGMKMERIVNGLLGGQA